MNILHTIIIFSLAAYSFFTVAMLPINNIKDTTLEISYCSIDSNNIYDVKRMLQENTSIDRLMLYSNRFTDETFYIMQSLFAIDNITTLHMPSSDISSNMIAHFALSLQNNTQLTELNLSDNTLKCEGCITIINSLQGNRTLTTLKLDGNHISYNGALELSNLIASNSTLCNLNIGNNPFTTDGVSHIISTLILNSSLKTVCLDRITIDSWQTLPNLIRNNTSMQSLHLYQSYSKANEFEEILASLSGNTHLRAVDLALKGYSNTLPAILINMFKNNSSLTDMTIDIQDMDIEKDIPHFKKAIESGIANNLCIDSFCLNHHHLPATVKSMLRNNNIRSKTLLEYAD